jgi:hypothetical protein
MRLEVRMDCWDFINLDFRSKESNINRPTYLIAKKSLAKSCSQAIP